jgi:hypothetical protein
MAGRGGKHRATVRTHEQTVFGHRAQIAPDRDLGGSEEARHIGDRNDPAGAKTLRDQPSALDRQHSADRTLSIIFEQ